MKRLALAVALASWACDDTPATASNPIDSFVRPDVRVDAGPPPDAAMDSRLWHVAAGADPRGATGTRDHPFASVEGAYAAARPGDVVFLLPGRHGAGVSPPVGVELLGSGRDVTELVGPLVLTAEGGRVGGLTVVDGPVRVEAPSTLVDFGVRGADAPALEIAAATELREVQVQDTAAADVATPAVRLLAPVTWTGGGVSGAAGVCVGGSDVVANLADLVIADCGSYGVAFEGGRPTLVRVRVDRAESAGVFLLNAEGQLSEVDVAETVYSEVTNTGSGVGVVGGTASLVNLRIRGGERGLRVGGGAQVTGMQLSIVGAGVGVGVSDESQATLSDVEIEDASSGGISAVRGTLNLRDATLRDVGRFGLLVSMAHADVAGLTVEGAASRGVSFQNATGRMEGFAIDRAGDVGVQVTDGEEVITLVDGTLTRCASAGISVFGGVARVERTTVEGSVEGADGFAEGVQIFDGRATLIDVEVRENAGAGILVETGSVVVEGGATRNNGEPGVVLVSASEPSSFRDFTAAGNASAGFLVIESVIALTDVLVEGSRLGPDGAGDGVAAVVSAQLTLRGGEIRNNASNGLFVLGGSHADVGGVEFVGNAGFGIAGCGNASVTETEPNTFRNNSRGGREACE